MLIIERSELDESGKSQSLRNWTKVVSPNPLATGQYVEPLVLLFWVSGTRTKTKDLTTNTCIRSLIASRSILANLAGAELLAWYRCKSQVFQLLICLISKTVIHILLFCLQCNGYNLTIFVHVFVLVELKEKCNDDCFRQFTQGLLSVKTEEQKFHCSRLASIAPNVMHSLACKLILSDLPEHKNKRPHNLRKYCIRTSWSQTRHAVTCCHHVFV